MFYCVEDDGVDVGGDLGGEGDFGGELVEELS